LFSAAKSEFKHMEYFYFHNCLYEGVWKENGRRSDRMPTLDLIRSYGADYKVIFVGDASMSPYEITHAGGSVEHWNQEPGEAWIRRVTEHFHRCVWLNPVPQDHWSHTTSIGVIRQLMTERMFPLTLGGLEQATRALTR
jgi:uncharacterized protein with von Willebrand factor type A (vWA) domain